MPTYEVGETLFIRETGKKYEPGEIVELAEEVAEYYITNNHASLKLTRRTAQAHPAAVRADPQTTEPLHPQVEPEKKQIKKAKK